MTATHTPAPVTGSVHSFDISTGVDGPGTRFVAFLGPLVAGTLIASFGGFGYAATIVSLIYILGLVAVWFLPETNGRPLPT